MQPWGGFLTVVYLSHYVSQSESKIYLLSLTLLILGKEY